MPPPLSQVVQPWVEAAARALLAGQPLPPVHTLDVELAPVLLSKVGGEHALSMSRGGMYPGWEPFLTKRVPPYPTASSQAAHMGLPDTWVDRLARHDPERKQVLKVSIDYSAPPEGGPRPLQAGDLVLAINGQTVSSFRDVEGVLLRASLGVETRTDRRGGWSVVSTPRASVPPGEGGASAGGGAKGAAGALPRVGSGQTLLQSLLRQPIIDRLMRTVSPGAGGGHTAGGEGEGKKRCFVFTFYDSP